MSRTARVEDASEDEDSDPEIMDPSDFDPRNSIITPADVPMAGNSSSGSSSSNYQQQHSAPPPQPYSQSLPQPLRQREIPRSYVCLYPLYFDKSRTRAEGRKVSSKLAVQNPLAREIVDAVQMLGLRTGLEPEKIHPKDWANPGRVRAMLKDELGRPVSSAVNNKHHLFILVARYLQQNPTTETSPFRLRIAGLPVPNEPQPAPPAPRGWKIGSVLPLHSPALTGGGVSANPLKETMSELEQSGMMPGGMPGGMGNAMANMAGPSGAAGGGFGGGDGGKKNKKKGRA